MITPEEIELEADANRIDRALADIERYRQEIQIRKANLMPPLLICLLRRNDASV